VLFVVNGEVTAEIGNERAELTTGDVVIVPADIDHRFSNPGKRKAITLNVYAPPAY
jgi:mannose-6-phosphate isomerase-like protein (cupin superfamily)